MSYNVKEEGNVATVYLDGEIDMDVTEKAKAKQSQLSLWKKE